MKTATKQIPIHVALTVITVAFLFPFYWIVVTSLKFKKDVLTNPPKWIFAPTLENYANVLRSADFVNSLVNSTLISCIVTVLVVLLGLLAAYAFSRYNLRSKSKFFFFVLTTRMGPPVAFILPLFLIMTRLRIVDTYLALVLTYLLMNLAFAIWMMKRFIDGIPIEVDEAARLDGCSTLTILLKVIWPLGKSGVFATAVFSFVLSWNEFFYALNLTRIRARTFPVLLPAYMGVMFPEWEKMCAASVLLSVPVIVLVLLISRHLVKAMTLGAVKG